MSKQKKFKLYTQNWLHIFLPRLHAKAIKENRLFLFFYYVGFGVLTFGKFLAAGVWRGCYFVGKSLKKISGIVKKQVLQTKISLDQRAKLFLQINFLKNLLLFGCIALMGWGVLFSVSLVARALQIKDQITGVSMAGKQYLEQAETQLQNKNFDAADQSFRLAAQSFSQGQQQLNATNASVGHLLSLLPQTNQAGSLLAAATELSQGGQVAVDFYQNVKSLHVSPEGINSAQPFPDVVRHLQTDLNQIQSDIAAAQQNLQGSSPSSLPAADREEFLQLTSQVAVLNQNFGNLKDMAQLMADLLLGQKNVLVMFENNDELRATGGFMGTFGNFNLDDGKVDSLNISSIYDLDGQLQEKIIPPTPILAVNQRWYLRDSNWFADFPQSAKKITDLYEKEGGQTPDLIIAMTPQFIIDALKTLGPISLPKYGITLDPDNFVEQTQVTSSIDDNSPTNNPKQVLADFFPIFLQKLSQAAPEQFGQILDDMQNNLTEKQIIIFSRDQNLESELSAYNWAGQVLPTDRDYLSVVSSNLGATKTDLYVNQTLSLKSTIDSTGHITDELTITRTNTMPLLDETENTSFIRIFVPAGSTLVSNIGFDLKTFAVATDTAMQVDPDVYNWEKTIVTDQLTGTMIGREAGKTFFGNWLTVAGGQTRTIKLVYTLPFTLASPDHYSLLLQKQDGSIDQMFNYDLHFDNWKLDWENFDTDTLDVNDVTTHLTLNKDYLLGEVLEKR